MSSWDHFERFTPAPKKPPPKHGIRMKKAGTTWWGKRWIEALQVVLRGSAARLARGRTYARAGRTHDLVVKCGKISAKVTGSAAAPYEITIGVAPLSNTAWARAIAGMAAVAQFSAELLAGKMPEDIDAVFREADVSLFPTRRADLVTSCSCPDWGDPCKHVAATHYVLGEALDRDPFLLFELRGKTKEQVLQALRDARGATSEPSARTRRSRKGGERVAVVAEPEIPTVRLGKLELSDYDEPRGSFPAIPVRFEEPITGGTVLRQLGAPSTWEGTASPMEVLAPLIRAAAEVARRIAMADARDGEHTTDEAPAVGSRRRALPSIAPKPARKRAAQRRGA